MFRELDASSLGRMSPTLFRELTGDLREALVIRGGVRFFGKLAECGLAEIERLGSRRVWLLRKPEQVSYGDGDPDMEHVSLTSLVEELRGWSPERGAFITASYLPMSPPSLVERATSSVALVLRAPPDPFAPPARTRLPELWSKLDVRDVVSPREVLGASLRLGSGRTHSALHTDPFRNVSVQIEGSKEWVLYDTEQNEAVAGPDGAYLELGSLIHRSRVDPFAPDADRFPLFASATAVARFTLGAGDLLYFPAYWWHCVRALTPSVSFRLELRAALREHLSPPSRSAVRVVLRSALQSARGLR